MRKLEKEIKKIFAGIIFTVEVLFCQGKKCFILMCNIKINWLDSSVGHKQKSSLRVISGRNALHEMQQISQLRKRL